MSAANQLCPCDTGETYETCCFPLHEETSVAITAEQLMRSRYSAYSLQKTDYLLKTTHPDKQTSNLAKEIKEWAASRDFFQLKIISTWQGQATDKTGKVEFIAHYRQQGKEQQLYEISRFRRYRKQWVYLDGEIR
jgi:SEC-C motif-containing protein